LETQPGQLEHAEFLDTSGADPRRRCATELVRVLRGVPVVFVYSAAFERTRIKELAALFPDLAEELLAIADRLIDLLPLVRQHYYHRDMLGSYSLKAVLPTMLGEDPYTKLDGVQGGGSAQAAYFESVQPETMSARRQQLAAQLRRYCRLDTWSTVVVSSVLQGKSPPPWSDLGC
jgi:predicted RecB family nuclease